MVHWNEVQSIQSNVIVCANCCCKQKNLQSLHLITVVKSKGLLDIKGINKALKKPSAFLKSYLHGNVINFG